MLVDEPGPANVNKGQRLRVDIIKAAVTKSGIIDQAQPAKF
jgi:hypothetical protein